jgi:hypothetical protein
LTIPQLLKSMEAGPFYDVPKGKRLCEPKR